MVSIHTNQWRPDTCECHIEFSFDKDLPNETRTHDFSRVISKCLAHSSQPDSQVLFDLLQTENKRKNHTRDEIIQRAPAELIDVDGDGNKTFKKGINVRWEWTGTAPDRVLQIYVTGYTLTQQQRNLIQNFLDNRLGAGKVILM